MTTDHTCHFPLANLREPLFTACRSHNSQVYDLCFGSASVHGTHAQRRHSEHCIHCSHDMRNNIPHTRHFVSSWLVLASVPACTVLARFLGTDDLDFFLAGFLLGGISSSACLYGDDVSTSECSHLRERFRLVVGLVSLADPKVRVRHSLTAWLLAQHKQTLKQLCHTPQSSWQRHRPTTLPWLGSHGPRRRPRGPPLDWHRLIGRRP